MGLTYPQFSMAFVVPSTGWNIDVTLSGLSFTATVDAGTYYLDDTTSQFFELLAADLQAKDRAWTGDGTAIWTVGYDGTTRNIVMKRTGISKSLTQFDFDAGEGSTLGATKDAYAWPSSPEAEWVGSAAQNPPTGTTITFTGTYQCAQIWLPEDYLMRNEHKAQRTIARSQSVTGRVLTDFYSTSWHRRNLVIEPVVGARIHQWMTDDTVFSTEAGVVTGDPNVSLEAFWNAHAVNTVNGTLPTVRVAPDKSDLTTYTEVWLSGEAWLQSMATAAEEISSDPALYLVKFNAQTVVT